ncbi:hypothetical protein OROMI_002631 [Orobanche minor]
MFKKTEDEFEDGFSDDGEEENGGFDAEEVSEDENDRIRSSHVQFVERIKAFKMTVDAFKLEYNVKNKAIMGICLRILQHLFKLSEVLTLIFPLKYIKLSLSLNKCMRLLDGDVSKF